MLECILVVTYIVIVVVRICEERVSHGKDIARRQVWRRQLCLGRIVDGKYFLGVVAQVLAKFIP